MDLDKILEEARKKQEMLKKYVYWLNRLTTISPDQKIYRIEPVDNFLFNIKQKKLYFKYPGAWQDIFDGAFVRTPIYFLKDGIRAGQAYKDTYFCQCWSGEEQEIMWKLYSKDCRGVMAVSTVDKMMNLVWNRSTQFMHTMRYVGDVIYCPVNEMRDTRFFERARLSGARK